MSHSSSGDRGFPAGEVRNQIVNNLDLTATIVDWAGAVAGRELDGRSLVPVLADGDAPWRTMLLVQGSIGDDADPTVGPDINRFSGAVSDRWRVFRNRLQDRTDVWELYDISAGIHGNSKMSPMTPTTPAFLRP